MSYNWNTRTELLFGAEHMERLSRSHVLVVGLGGVGAYADEQICRAGPSFHPRDAESRGRGQAFA